MSETHQPLEGNEPRRGSHVWGGLLLIGIGIWALLAALGVPWANMERLWPVALIGGGVASLVGALRAHPREPGGVWFGVTAILSGCLFLYVTLPDPARWAALQALWPLFVAAAGLGWLAAWAAAPRQIPLLVLGLTAAVVGIVAYLAKTGVIAWDPWRQLSQWWPLLLVLLGVASLAQAFIRRDR